MHFFSITKIAMLTLIALASGVETVGQTSNATPSPPSPSSNVVADTPELLKEQLRGLMDDSRFRETLVIPNHQHWFLTVFGSGEGPRLENRYTEMQKQEEVWFRASVIAADAAKSELDVFAIRTKADVNALSLRGYNISTGIPNVMQPAFEAMAVPVIIYRASIRGGPTPTSPKLFGDFVFIENSFRYVDWQVFQALSTAPPARILVSGNIQNMRLVKRVEPVYPPEAKQKHLAGRVLLHVIVGVDGTVKQVEVFNGDAIFQEAAIDAVKQWSYQPTLINFAPVEVETAVSIIFEKR